MKGTPIRFGIIGGGLMGREVASAMARWCHLLDRHVRPELVAVCDRALGLLDWFTANLDTVDQATTDYRQLLANPKVKAVYCAVPHNLHRQMYVHIIAAGKHLLGEKPFGIDLAAKRAIGRAVAAVCLVTDVTLRSQDRRWLDRLAVELVTARLDGEEADHG